MLFGRRPCRSADFLFAQKLHVGQHSFNLHDYLYAAVFHDGYVSEKDGRVKLKDCVSQRTGKIYNADLLLTTEEDGRAKFQMEFDNSGKNGGKKK